MEQVSYIGPVSFWGGLVLNANILVSTDTDNHMVDYMMLK